VSGFIAAGYNNKTMRLVTDVENKRGRVHDNLLTATTARRGKLTEAAEETLWTSVYSAVLHHEYQTLKAQHPAW
jgi:hypothetical protein